MLAYRSVAIWLPAPFGLVMLSGLRRTVARWNAEDGRRPDVTWRGGAAQPVCA